MTPRPRSGIATVLALVLPVAASAATFTVDSTVDAVDETPGDGVCRAAAGECTLRAAVQEANALPGPDTVDVPAGIYLLILGPDTGLPDAATGDLDVTDPLVLAGAGAGTTIIDGNHTSRILDQAALVDITVSGLTIRNGEANGGLGGGILTIGSGTMVTVSDCIISGNHALAGGGIGTDGVTVLRSIVTGNSADIVGGGIGLAGGTIRDSAVYGNTNGNPAFHGDDVAAATGVVAIANTTVGGTIEDFSFCAPPLPPTCVPGATMTVSNVTAGALVMTALDALPGTMTVRNSIVLRCSAGAVSQGYNLVEQVIGPCLLSGDTATDVIGVPALLGPLADNGGPTPTRMPLAGSPALNAANPAAPGGPPPACEATDQRGIVRPVAGRCDIGAVESACGNGTVDPGEGCDDGNGTSGDGCDANCRPTGCGNGIVTAGEQCDDGNTVAGDCCGPSCQLEAAGSPCASDGNVCTDDVCDGAGACGHLFNAAPCDDGSPCTTDDHCAGGTCQAGAFCDECLACNPSIGCVEPADTCSPAPPRGAALKVQQGGVDAKDAVTLSWRGGPVDKEDFGDPLATQGVRLCVYDGAGALVLHAEAPPDGTCGTTPCWREKTTGFLYRDREQSPDGLAALKLVAGDPGRIRVHGKGANLRLGPAALPLATPVRTRVEQGYFHAGRCWSASFDADVHSNTAALFKARSP